MADNEQLVARIKNGDNEAENMLQLWQQNQRLIEKIARRYSAFEDMEDLMQQGYIGLCDAVRCYKFGKGVKFSTYAFFWIQQNMSHYLETCGNCIRMPSSQQQKIRKLRQIEEQCLKTLGRMPAELELCRLLEMDRESLQQLQLDALKTQIKSLDAPAGDEEETLLEDYVPDQRDGYADALERLCQQELKAVLWPMVDALEGRQSIVLRNRYQRKKTIKETGEALGISLGAVRQIESKALRELRKPSKASRLRPFLPETIEAQAYRHNGVMEFNRTWTSSTERAALC